MKTTKPKAAAAARIGAALGRRKHAELLELLRPCFARTEPWLQAGKYAAAVMCDLRRRNGWTIAAQAGDRAPDRTQRLLSRAAWDAAAAMRVVRQFAVAGLDEAAGQAGRRRGLAVGAIDETGQVKAGTRTAGVKRQYLGCVGKAAKWSIPPRSGPVLGWVRVRIVKIPPAPSTFSALATGCCGRKSTRLPPRSLRIVAAAISTRIDRESAKRRRDASMVRFAVRPDSWAAMTLFSREADVRSAWPSRTTTGPDSPAATEISSVLTGRSLRLRVVQLRV